MKRAVKALVALFAVSAISMGTFTAPESGISNGIMCVTAEAKSSLKAPQNIKSTAKSTTITISWDKVIGADAYRVYMYDENQKKYTVCKNVAGTACQITDLTANKTYYFKVAALVKNKEKYTEQERSGQITVKTKSPFPASPSADYTGFATANNKKYYFEQGKICLGFKKIGSDYYYFIDDGSMLTGWLDYYGRYYYFYSDGKMVAGKSLKFSDGKTYTFKNDGMASLSVFAKTPTASYSIMGEEPKYSIWMSDDTDYTSIVLMEFTNKGNKNLTIFPAGKLRDDDYSSFDRTIGIMFRGLETVEIEPQIIKPGETVDLGWVCVPNDTWYDEKTKLDFYIKYDNVVYSVTCSSYYGAYHYVVHFDPSVIM